MVYRIKGKKIHRLVLSTMLLIGIMMMVNIMLVGCGGKAAAKEKPSNISYVEDSKSNSGKENTKIASSKGSNGSPDSFKSSGDESEDQLGAGDCILLFHEKHSKNDEKRLTKLYYFNRCEQTVQCRITYFDTFDVSGRSEYVTETEDVEFNGKELKPISTSITFKDHPGEWQRFLSSDIPISYPIDKALIFENLKKEPIGELIIAYLNMFWDEQNLPAEERKQMSEDHIMKPAFDKMASQKLMPCQWKE